MPPVLRVDNLCKTYRMGDTVVRALRDVNLCVDAGEFVALMGASGSGKSTLLHLIGGLDVPTSGDVEVEGRSLASLSDRDRTLFRRGRMGIVFQSFNLLPTLTAKENVALPLMIAGVADRDAARRADVLLRTVDLQHRAQHRPDAMSGGEQQRVAIARSLINDPAVLLATEQKRTIVAVTHEASGATFADRVVVLKDGSVTGQFEPGGEDRVALVANRYQELAG